MKRITKTVWSHNTESFTDKEYPRTVRTSEPKLIKRYQDLVEEIAIISFNNPDQNLYYRGQNKDYKNSSGGTSIYPSIMRRLKRTELGRKRLKRRVDKLMQAEDLILNGFKNNKITGYETLRKFKEVRWAILQHYEVCDTPLVDITSSLRGACSFALQRNKANYGYVFVFGFPHVNGSISYYVEEELLNLKLLSICPPDALRPHYQEGYLVGTFPSDYPEERSVKFDIANRLIAKYKIPKDNFWSKKFPEIPEAALFPVKDFVDDICYELIDEL